VTLRQRIEQWLKEQQGGYRKLALDVGVSPGTIANIMAGYPPSRVSILKKFAAYFKVPVADLLEGASREPGRVYDTAPRPQPAVDRLLDIAEDLDAEETAALLHCAESLRVGSMEVRQHIINQMKMVERFVALDRKQARRKKAEA
jgi:transcriptional regulator with XRE-family HTH domain